MKRTGTSSLLGKRERKLVRADDNNDKMDTQGRMIRARWDDEDNSDSTGSWNSHGNESMDSGDEEIILLDED